MYYPYFRGKQYDLITLRECAQLMAERGFVPIIEPVKESVSALVRTLQTLKEKNCEVVLVINPNNGDHSIDSSPISELMSSTLADYTNVRAGILLTKDITAQDAVNLSQKYTDRGISFIHSGFDDPIALADLISSESNCYEHIFIEESCGKLYRRHFKNTKRILIRDGFRKKQANKHYEDEEFFSDLHVTFKEEGMDGFGDFLIVGDNYSESGGPAYAVAIHISYIDATKEKVMYIHHFKSDRNDTPTDPGGKFAEALSKLIVELNKPDTKILSTAAIMEFKSLHNSGHFPGLGSVKKLSMKHHIETMADYFSL